MEEDSYNTIKNLLASNNPEELRHGMELVKKEIARIGSSEARQLFEMISAIFYIDTLDHPDLVPILDEAISLTVGFGKWVVPVLIENLEAGDLKAQLAISHALGRIGADAIQPLITEYKSSSDPDRHTFILYALSKIKSPMVVQAAQLALDATQSPDRELRDTATRAIGKFAESIPPSRLSEDLRKEFREKLEINLADPNANIRTKAVRSLGKLAKYGHLTTLEREKLRLVCQRILGTDDSYDWDRAFTVRKEAEEALKYV